VERVWGTPGITFETSDERALEAPEGVSEMTDEGLPETPGRRVSETPERTSETLDEERPEMLERRASETP